MSLTDQRKRLARLEALRRGMRQFERELTETEIARCIGFVLAMAVDGIGGPQMLECGTLIAKALAKAPPVTPEMLEAVRERNKRAGLKHGV